MGTTIVWCISVALLSGCASYQEKPSRPAALAWHSGFFSDGSRSFIIEADYDGSLCGGLYLSPSDGRLRVDVILLDATGAIVFRTKNGQKIELKIDGKKYSPSQDTVFRPVYARWKENMTEAVLCHYHLQLGCMESCLSLDGDSVASVDYRLTAKLLFDKKDTITVANGTKMADGKWETSEAGCTHD